MLIIGGAKSSLDLTNCSGNSVRMGSALCLLSAACFGAMAVFGKLAYAAGVTPGQLLVFRFVIACAVLAVALAVRPNLRSGPLLRTGGMSTGRAVVVALGLGVFGYAIQSTLYFTALQHMDASLLSLIFYTYPVLVTVASVILRRTRLTAARVTALTVASLGTVLVLLGAAAGALDLTGTLLAVGTAVTYTGYILVAETVVGRLPPVVLATLVLAGASASLVVRALLTGDLRFGFAASGWVWLSCIALISTVTAILTFFAGLRRAGASNAAILSTLEPVVTTTLAAAALGEVLTPLQLLGGLLVLSSALVLQAPGLGRRRRRNRAVGPTVLGGAPERVGVEAAHT